MKTDYSFPNQQFSLDGYKLRCKDRSNFGGSLLFCVNENMPCRELTAEQIDSNFEIIFLEITLRTQKRSVIGLYKPRTYEHIILFGDFN